MYMELHEVSTIIAGYTFRGAIKPDINGHIFVFQAKDLIQGEPITDTSTLTKISHDIPGYMGYLKKNDVLVVARGMKAGSFRSTVFATDADNVIASSSVHVIRSADSRILPEFISLYLNSKEGQEAISQIVTGSYIGAVPRKSLEKIKIPLLPLERQKTFIELDQNIREQQRITNRQNEIRQNIINATFRNLITT
jgi:restriction endonuclease S subunit